MVETLLGIQIIALCFAGFMLYVAFIHFKKSHISRAEFAFWLFVWASFIFFTLNPRVLDPLLAQLFVTRAMDLLMIIAFMILAYLGFSNHVNIKILQRQIQKLVSEQAQKHAKKT